MGGVAAFVVVMATEGRVPVCDVITPGCCDITGAPRRVAAPGLAEPLLGSGFRVVDVF